MTTRLARTRLKAAALALCGIAAAAGGGGAALASSGTPAITHAKASTQAATATTPRYVVLDCSLKPVVAPSTIIITCADAGIGVRGLHWTSWTPKLASGYGIVLRHCPKPASCGCTVVS